MSSLRQSLFWPLPFQCYASQISLSLPQTFSDFHLDSTVQLYFYTFAELLLQPIMQVSNVILRVIIDHDASIEGVKP